MITNNETKTTGTAGIPAGAIGDTQSTPPLPTLNPALPPAVENIVLPQHLIDFCKRTYPPHLGTAFDTQRAYLIARRLIVEGLPPLTCDILTFMASPAFAQLKQCPVAAPEQPTEKIAPQNSTTSATNIDSQPVTQIDHPQQSETDAKQSETDPQQSGTNPAQPETQAHQTATDPQQKPTPADQPQPLLSNRSVCYQRVQEFQSLSTIELQSISDDYCELIDKRSPLDQLTPEQQDAIYQLLTEQPLRDVAAWLSLEPPIGLGLKIHYSSLARFGRRHKKRLSQRSIREKLEHAEKIVIESGDMEQGMSKAATQLLQGRVLKATAHDDTDPLELKTLVLTLNSLRKQTLAERKFAAS